MKIANDGKRMKGQVIKSDTSYTLEVLLSNNEIVKVPREYLADKKEIKDVEVVRKIGREIEGIYRVIEGMPILNVKELQQIYKRDILGKVIKEGDVIDVTITSVATFGAFVELCCGVIALLPYNYVSEAKAINVEKVFREKQAIKVVYKGKTPEGKYLVSQKELLGTWSENVADFNEGDITTGLVKDVTDYGVFIEIAPNLTGIADKPDVEVRVGDSLVVRVKKSYPDKLKLKLHILGESYKPYKVRYNYKITEGNISDWNYNS